MSFQEIPSIGESHDIPKQFLRRIAARGFLSAAYLYHIECGHLAFGRAGNALCFFHEKPSAFGEIELVLPFPRKRESRAVRQIVSPGASQSAKKGNQLSKGSWFALVCLLSGLGACATNITAPKTTQIPEPQALILGQDYSELGAALLPLGTMQRTQILKANNKPVKKEELYSLKVPPGEYRLNLNCTVVLDNSIRISNAVELRITAEGGNIYQLDARATQDRHCTVAVKK